MSNRFSDEDDTNLVGGPNFFDQPGFSPKKTKKKVN
jgi:hypothetical protein